MRIRDMRGLGPKSEQQLEAISIHTPEELRAVGAVPAFIALCEASDTKPSLNFLYSLVGAIEDRAWQDVAREDRGRLLAELEGHRVLHALFTDGNLE